MMQKRTPQNEQQKSIVMCNYCKKTGHLIRDCRSLKYEQQGNQPQNDQNNRPQCQKCGQHNNVTQDCKCRNLQCEKCGCMGHIGTVCLSNRNRTDNNFNRNNNEIQRNEVNTDGKLKCYNCNRFGHLARVCKVPIRQNMETKRVQIDETRNKFHQRNRSPNQKAFLAQEMNEVSVLTLIQQLELE